MGLLDSIQNAASSIGSAVSDGVDHAKDAAEALVHKVQEAPAAIARGASQAIEGIKQLGPNLVRTGAKLAGDGVALMKQGPSEVLAAVGRGAKSAASWAWDHKGEIGFWVGTTALMLAVPVSGGASGALAGGMMAARGAAIAAKIAQTGRVGLAAVNAARAGATAVQGVRAAIGASKLGSIVSGGGEVLRAGRVALGGTKLGRGMIAAQKPVTAASTVLAGVNFADTSVKYAKGDASAKQLALSALGFAPAGVGAMKSVAARRAASANAQAAHVASAGLDDVAAQAAGASDEVAEIAHLAPRVNAPKTAGKAEAALEDAVLTTDRAVQLRRRTLITAKSANADDAISASTLVDELDRVASRAGRARSNAASAEELAPDALTPTATAARRRLAHAEQVATRTRDEIASLATTQRRADRFAARAAQLKELMGATSLHAGNISSGVRSVHEHGGWSLNDGSFVKGIAAWLLHRNAAAVAAPSTTRAMATRAS